MRRRFGMVFFVWLIIAFCCVDRTHAVEARVSDAQSAQQAINHARPGDVIVLANGLYDGFQVQFESKGTRDQPIVFKAQTPGQVVLTGDVRIVVTGQYLGIHGFVFDQAWGSNIIGFENAQYCRMTDCAFVECGNPKSTFSHIVTFRNGSQNNRADHCYMQGNLSMGMGVRNTGKGRLENTDNRFDHNYYKDIIRRHSNGQEAVQLGQSTRKIVNLRATVEYCVFDNASGDAEIISNKSSHNVYRYNTFLNCKAELVLRGATHALVEGNYFFGGNGGVRIHGKHHRVLNNYMENLERGISLPTGTDRMATDTFYHATAHCLIAHNTIVNCRDYAIRFGQNKGRESKGQVWDAPPFDNRIVNNVIVGKSGTLIRDEFSENTIWERNVLWATDAAEAGLEADGIELADPKLVKSDERFRPQKDSPLIDRAVSLDGVTDDMDGQARGAQPDIGADEVSDAPVGRALLKIGDVGPAWMHGDPETIVRLVVRKPIPEILKK